MTDMVDNEQDQNTEAEVVDLFATGFDDKALLAEENDDKTAEDASVDEGGDEPEPSEDLPEKYRGKSIRDVIDMHQNLEKAYGRHNNELGELRQLTDQILKQQLEAAKPADAELDTDSLLENPSAAINKAIDSNPRLASIQAQLEARARAEQKHAFDKIHPDADKVINDPRFAAWITESPTRANLFKQADANYDYELASELLNLYKGVSQGAVEHQTTQVRNQMGSPSKNAGSGGGAKKQVFRRTDLMRLKAEDPDRYERLQPQILQAYQEGRVK